MSKHNQEKNQQILLIEAPEQESLNSFKLLHYILFLYRTFQDLPPNKTAQIQYSVYHMIHLAALTRIFEIWPSLSCTFLGVKNLHKSNP